MWRNPTSHILGLPRWLRGRVHLPSGRRRSCRFKPWVRKIPWRRKWQPAPVFLPEKSHDRRTWRATVHGVAKSQTYDWATKPPPPQWYCLPIIGAVLWYSITTLLKVSCNVESQILSVSFLYSVILTLISLFCTVKGSFNHTWFCSMHWSLENTADLLNVDTFHYTISKNHIC